MKLPSTQISKKVRNATLSAAIVTIIVGFVADTPLSTNEWGRALSNPATVGAIVTLVGAVAGYQTEETVYNTTGSSDEDFTL